MNTTALDIHALTPTISRADVDYFAHLAKQRGAAVTAYPTTLARLARAAGCTIGTHPAAPAAQLARVLGVPVLADPTVPAGIVLIQQVTVDAPST